MALSLLVNRFKLYRENPCSIKGSRSEFYFALSRIGKMAAVSAFSYDKLLLCASQLYNHLLAVTYLLRC